MRLHILPSTPAPQQTITECGNQKKISPRWAGTGSAHSRSPHTCAACRCPPAGRKQVPVNRTSLSRCCMLADCASADKSPPDGSLGQSTGCQPCKIKPTAFTRAPAAISWPCSPAALQPAASSCPPTHQLGEGSHQALLNETNCDTISQCSCPRTSLGKAASRPSMRMRLISTNCRATSAAGQDNRHWHCIGSSFGVG